MSDTESLEPIGEAGRDDVPFPVDADEIRGEIEQARAATDRFRAKATELIKELRDRETQAREIEVVCLGRHASQASVRPRAGQQLSRSSPARA